jgi:hypothetical protein
MLPATQAVDLKTSRSCISIFTRKYEEIQLSIPSFSRRTIARIEEGSVTSNKDKMMFNSFPRIEWCFDSEVDNNTECTHLCKRQKLSKHLSIRTDSSSPCQLRRSKRIYSCLCHLQDPSLKNRSKESLGACIVLEPVQMSFRVTPNVFFQILEDETGRKDEPCFENSMGIVG